MTRAGRRTREFPDQAGLPPTWQGKPAGLVPIERQMWRAFADQFVDTFTEWWFNIRLTGNPDPTPELPLTPDPIMTNLVGMWGKLTAYRCDAIAKQGPHYRIVEFRAQVNPQTIGEVLIYDALARKQFPSLRFSPPVLVAFSIDEKLHNAATLRGIDISILDVDDTDTLPP